MSVPKCVLKEYSSLNDKSELYCIVVTRNDINTNNFSLYFVGTDPASKLHAFAEEMRFTRKLHVISLGKGQGPRAEQMFREAAERGR